MSDAELAAQLQRELNGLDRRRAGVERFASTSASTSASTTPRPRRARAGKPKEKLDPSVEAAKRGILDSSETGPVFSFVRDTVLSTNSDAAPRLVSRLPPPSDHDNGALFATARAALTRTPQQRALAAPPLIVEAVEACCRPSSSFEEGMAVDPRAPLGARNQDSMIRDSGNRDSGSRDQ